MIEQGDKYLLARENTRHYPSNCMSNADLRIGTTSIKLIRRQAIIWTNAGILLIGPLGTNFSEILIAYIFIQTSIWKCRLWNGSHLVSTSMC